MGWNIMVGNSAKGLILLIFLIILTVADARVLRSGPGDSLDLQTNGVNSRLEILSSGEIDAKTQFRLLDSVVFPVKTTAERDALTLVDGLSVWNTDNDQMNIYDLTGATWRVLLDTDSIIPRNKVATGTANYVLINDGSGNLSEEQFLDKTRGGAGADMSSVTFPGTGTIVTETGTSVLTNKDIDGGTASNTSRITLGKDTTVNLDALTDKAGTIWYDTTLGAVVFNNGTNNIELATGGGGPALVGDYAFRIYRNSAQNVTTTSATVIQFDAEAIDNGGGWNTTTYRFTPNLAGRYYVRVQCYADSLTVGAGDIQCAVRKNGTDQNRQYLNPLSTSVDSWSGNSDAIVNLNGTTDYVDFSISSGSDSNYNLPASVVLLNAIGFRLSEY